MTVNPPKYQNWLTTGNVLTILFGVITATGMFFVMDARSHANAEEIKEIKVDLKAVEMAIDKLEKDQIRSSERYDNVIELLTKIDKRLERIEAQR